MSALQPVAAGNQPRAPKTVSETYKKLSQLEHILLRPDTYIGSAARAASGSPVHVWDAAENGIRARDVVYAPGLYKIFDEILVNAADHMQRNAGMKTLRVEIEEENGRISVWNDGAGIPVVMHDGERVWIPELIFGHLLTSSNYDDGEKKVVGGRNGYGAKLANIFSTEFIVETADSERGKKYKQVFRQNMSVVGKPSISDSKKRDEDWTRITFFPDFKRFGMDSLDADIVALMTKRVYDVAATNASLKVWLNGSKLPLKGFKDYIKLYHGENPTVSFVHERCGERWEIAVGASGGAPEQVSFVNSISTIKGGTHVDHVVNQIVIRVQEYILKKNKGMKVKPHQVKSHLSVFVNALIENPAFDSQTKETLTSKMSTFGSKCVIPEDSFKKILKSGIVENVLSYAKFKETKELAKTDGGKKARVIGVPKLDDANKAGGREASKCTLILTEGDSAKALAVSGLSVIGRDYFGVFPLRGKLLNVREANHKQIMDNAEITNLKKILGLQQGKKYTADNIKSLRYGHVLIMTDQDHDGSHIKGLLINFFNHFWPELLKVDGFLQEFITPIVKCVKGKSEKTFFTMPEYEHWFETAGPGWKPKYYKGLGTSTAAEAKTYFSNLVQHLLTFNWSGEEDGKMIELAFAKSKVNDRKQWLTDHVPGTYFDHAVDELTYSNFINKELVLFSIADNARSIPSVIDGLKPSQRKVLFACFKRKLIKNEIKVAQLAGYVSEHAAYHHGEASLQATILGLAQNFVGSNNANLLVPAGQFGTRLQGGKDAASSRYIFTKLAPIARALFPEHDDRVLEYLEDDGLCIEPLWYCPVIPTVLLNGADGIGTGWSSQVPCYNPRDLIANIRRMLKGESPDDLIPWYRGFQGSIIPVGNAKSYDVHGTVLRGESDDVYKIRELPIRTWTTPFKDFLESAVVGGPDSGSKQVSFIKEYSDQGTENKVSFTVMFTPEAAAEAANGGIYKKLKLSGSVSTSNMMLFDAEGRIAKYEDTSAIFNEFFGVRMTLYAKRRAFLLGELQSELECLDNKQRFILMVVDGKLKVSKRTKDAIVQDLTSHGFKRIPKSTTRTGKDGKNGKGQDSSLAARSEEDSSTSASEGEDNGGGGLSSSSASKDFDYLLSMPIWSLTMERVQKLCAQRDEKAAERDAMERTSAADLWREDLAHLEDVLAEDEAVSKNDAAELAKAARAAQRKQAGARGRGRASSKAVPHASVDDEEYDVDCELVPPPSARKEKIRQPRRAKEPIIKEASSAAGTSATTRRPAKAKKAPVIELDEYDSEASSDDEEPQLLSDNESSGDDGRDSPAEFEVRIQHVNADGVDVEDMSNDDADDKVALVNEKVSMAKKRQPAQSCKPAQTRKPGVAVKTKSLVSDESAATNRTSKKRAVPRVSAPVDSDVEVGSSSDEDDRANLSLAERLAQRGRAAVGGLVKSSSGAGSSSARVLSSSLIPSFSSPVPQSKRPRARKGSAVVDMCSPSPAQAKKKTRVFSPVAAKPKKQNVLTKKPAARGNVKSKVVAKRLEPESEPDEHVSVHEKSDCDVDCENAMEDKKPLARPRRGGTRKPVVVESSSEDENDDGASDFEGDDDDDDSDFE
jgi:DNA topoisomerase II